MAAQPAQGFDLGPLTWVKTEIDHSLNQARENLDKLSAVPGERAPVKYILTHLHQATGALAMVGLGAGTRFNEELEKLVASLESAEDDAVARLVPVAKKGISALAGYLDVLIQGEPDHPMVLLPAYIELNRAHGASDAGEGDLFYPDLTASLPLSADGKTVLDDAVLAKALAHQRVQYQQGLLKMLRGTEVPESLRLMHGAVTAIETMQSGTPNRAFWTSAAGFLDALAFEGIELNAGAKQLFAKLDQQLKQLIDGSNKVSERLFRDLLLVVGRSRVVTDRVRILKETYRLEELLERPDRPMGDLGDEALKGLLRELRELVALQKDIWLKYTSGNRAAIEPFGKQALQLADRAAKLPNRDLQFVMVRLTDVAPALKARQSPPSEALALEVATALLFVETALENYFKLGADISRQARAVTERLKAAAAGQDLPQLDPADRGFLDEMTRRAQEKLLVFQVGQEVQVNLQNIEQVLDGFFRDPSRRQELDALPQQFAQVQGALMIMELNEAAELNGAVMARVKQFADGSVQGEGMAAEMVADGLSALGLYITALQQGASRPLEALHPALVRFGLVLAPHVVAAEESKKTGTISPLDIEVHKQKVQALYEDWREAPAEASKEKLEKAVDELNRDAAVISDTAVARQSAQALEMLKTAQSAATTGMFDAMKELAPENAPQAPTPQVVQMLDAPGAEIDQELLDIFLEEAVEVIATVTESLAAARKFSHDREALTTIRRGFHTLKGSGRMVGLTELGEVAWQVEQVMNKWLKEEKHATPGLLGLIELARTSFGGWVASLTQGRETRIDGAEIARYADMLKNDIEPPAFVASEAAPAARPPTTTSTRRPKEEVLVTLLANIAEEIAGDPDIEMPEEEPAEESIARAVEAPEETPTLAMPTMQLPAPDLPALDLASPQETQVRAPEEPAELVFETLGLMPEAAPTPPEAPRELEPESAGTMPAEELPALELPAFEMPVAGELAEPDVAIGEVRLAPAFFQIYLGESEQHVATLEREMAAIEASAMQPVSHEFMRAAHTLTSSSRTTGFENLADVAHALEKWLAAAIDFPPEFDARRLQVTRLAVDTLASMVRSLGAQQPPVSEPMLIEELRQLREGLQESRRTGQGTHIRVPTLGREIPAEAAAPGVETAEREAAPAADHPVEAPPAPEELDFAALVAEAQSQPQPAPPPVVVEAPATEVAAELPPLEVSEVAALPEAAAAPEMPSIPPVALEAVAPVGTDAPKPAISNEAAVAALAAAAMASTAEEARPEKQIEVGKEQRRVRDDVDRDLLPIFLDEAREVLPQLGAALRAWRARPEVHLPAVDLRRYLHTLKGSARMTGLMRLGELAHLLEEKVIAMGESTAPPQADFDHIEERVDRFNTSLDRLASGGELQDLLPLEVPVSAMFEQQKDKPTAIAMIAAASAELVQQAAMPDARERVALLRVDAAEIDRFVNEAGELSIARSRIEGEMSTFRRALVDLADSVNRMRTQLREIEIQAESQMQSTILEKQEHGQTFDPLEFDRFTRMQELTRFLAESLGDVITLQQSLQKNLDETELAILQQARLNRELQTGLMGIRLVPLANLSDRFYRVVRQTAKELGKKANLEIRGARAELDRSVLEKITAPFEHLLRNAVAHGLEEPQARVAAGKPEIGEIMIDAQQRGNEIVLTVSDDGAGLDFARIREKAIEAGLLDRNAELAEGQLAQFIFMTGFSTAREVTQVAGRGVGMDVVKNEITSLGGRVEIGSVAGKGTTFTVTLPLTLAVTQAVMLRAGQSTFAVPSVMVEQVQEYKSQAFAAVMAKGEVEWNKNSYPLRSLLPLLGQIDTPTPARQIPVLLLKSGVQRAAVRVDQIIGNREVVVKTIGPQLARLAGIAGATVLGNGQVVLILNPVQLVHRDSLVAAYVAVPQVAEEAALVVEQKSGAPLVMVVDDSLTVRKITSRMLAREGYEIATAKDGVDALQQLQDITPDCILLDVEMPRMDGFEFARNVRADEATKSIPIIMITSRTADKHRNHALEIGVNEYMGKPYQEEQLLALIKRYTELSALA